MLAPSRIGLLVGALLAVGTLGACGGSSVEQKNTYVDEINAALETYAATVTKTRSSITPDSSTAEDQRSFDRFEAAIKDVIATLKTIEVPTEVSKEHDRLVGVFTGLGGEVTDARTTMRTQTARAQAEGQRLLGAATVTANTQQDAARQAINEKLRSG